MNIEQYLGVTRTQFVEKGITQMERTNDQQQQTQKLKYIKASMNNEAPETRGISSELIKYGSEK